MRPESEGALAEIIRNAEGPLAIRGGGTRPVGRPVAGEDLSLVGIAGIALYEPGALTLVAAAGTSLAAAEAALAAEGQRLAFEPMDHRVLLGTSGEPTIGGVVAANVSGPRRIQAGACRDSLLGLRFVDGRGEIVKNGGRVMKNVTGYDLVKLLAGSRGTLGVLTEVSLKVLPAPETAAGLTIAGLGIEEAVAAMSAALGSPFEVTGAAHLPAERLTHLRIEGFEASVAYRARRLQAAMSRFGPVDIEDDTGRLATLWAGLRDVAPLAGKPGEVWRISVMPSEAVSVAAALPEAELLLDWGGGRVWARVRDGFDLRTALAGIRGHATLVKASETRRSAGGVFQPQPAAVGTLEDGLRSRFDPRGILNTGLMS
ncbi:FAD-binding protein [Tropicimonas sp. IMCC6043]|uniref:FAD-binding protein n=1 Tax=Tropicimonas sp. IMCC6043 TaxID=2510645 RepID=UPI00101C345B|nr:FAD-binding protein [Tropicimonas sp. IMCC6043]RYH08346.1 FAD-binding protein [Tropicimonas sp. IMCC6043]